MVCIYFGHKLTNAYGPWLADALGVEYEHGQRTAIEVFFAAAAAIIGIVVYRATRSILRTYRYWKR